MSFDLFFKPRHAMPDAKAIKSYFFGRLHHSGDDGSTTYFNEDTDVVFDIRFDDATDDSFPIQFNINVFRPSYFMLEAEPEIAAFVRNFDLEVLDPQQSDTGDGRYDPERIVESWDRSNQSGYDFLLAEPGERERFRFLPTQKNQQIWRWNCYEAQALQAEVGPGKFVPRISFFEFDGRFGTAMVWPDGAPLVALPVDWLIVTRYDRQGESAQNRPVVDWQAAMDEVAPYLRKGPGGTIAFDFAETPNELSEFLEDLPFGTTNRQRWPSHGVLDLEMADRATAQISARTSRSE